MARGRALRLTDRQASSALGLLFGLEQLFLGKRLVLFHFALVLLQLVLADLKALPHLDLRLLDFVSAFPHVLDQLVPVRAGL